MVSHWSLSDSKSPQVSRILLSVVYWPPTRPNMPFQRRWKSIFHWRGRAWLTYGTRLKSYGTVTNWCTGREWPVKCMTVISARWRSNMPFKRRRKCIFRWPVMGRYWVGIGLLYNWVHRKFKEFWRQDVVEKASTQQKGPSGPPIEFWGSDKLEKWCCRENSTPQRAALPGPPVEQPRRTERNAEGHKSGGQYVAVLFGLQLPLTHNPFK